MDLPKRKPNRLKEYDYSQPGYYFITICTHQMRQLFWSPQAAPTIPRIINQFKGRVSKRAGASLWQKGFHDHIIRSESTYLRI